MITDSRITDYINSLDPGDGELCDGIAREAVRSGVPIVRRETAALIKTMLALKKPERILEVGTAVGYSALLMARSMPETAHITTIEKYEKRIPIARENFKRAGMEEKITLLEGDAGEILGSLSGSFDFIFMDAAKGQYLNFLPDVIALMADDAMLVSDNIFHDGDVLESRYAVLRRDRTIHGRMREYLQVLCEKEELETICLPIADGMTISTKKGNGKGE